MNPWQAQQTMAHSSPLSLLGKRLNHHLLHDTLQTTAQH